MGSGEANMDIHDVIIVGAGPAGLSAGVYCARKMLDTLVVSANVGGQAAWSWEVENYLGYQLITGAELVEHFRDHLVNFRVKLLEGKNVTDLYRENALFIVRTEDGEEFASRAAIAASGKVPRMLGIPGEREFRGRGVAYCATCDAPLFRKKRVAVVGGGNSALDAALQLAQIAERVYLITNQPLLGGDEIRRGQVLDASVVEVLTSTEVTALRGEKFVESMELLQHGAKGHLEVQGVFIEIGSIPSTSYLPAEVERNHLGEIVIDSNNRTSLSGLFAAGDVTDIMEKQIIIAAGEGAKAALAAYSWLVQAGYLSS